MKLTTSVLSGLALCVASVAAQNFGSLPTCAQGCATNAIPASCGLDVTCICSTSSFITSVSCCVATACDAADQQATIQFAQQLCAGAGITSLPSAAGCSATTGAATSTAAGSTTSKASAASTAVTSTKTSAKISAKTSASAVGSSSAVSANPSTTGTGSASSSASSTSHSGAATPLAKSNGVAAVGAGAAALLAAIFV